MNILKLFSPKNQFGIKPHQSIARAIPSIPVSAVDGNGIIDPVNFRGKKLLIINTASRCGFTPQYSKWEAFYQNNKHQLEIIACPSNDFMYQEPGTNSDIEKFCRDEMGVSYFISEKISVTGKNKHPLFDWLSNSEKNGWCKREPVWNFSKYLLNENGELVAWLDPAIQPDHVDFLAAYSLL